EETSPSSLTRKVCPSTDRFQFRNSFAALGFFAVLVIPVANGLVGAPSGPHTTSTGAPSCILVKTMLYSDGAIEISPRTRASAVGAPEGNSPGSVAACFFQ